MMETKELFTDIQTAQDEHNCKAQLAQMIALLGPPSKELLNKANKWNWSPRSKILQANCVEVQPNSMVALILIRLVRYFSLTARVIFI